MRLVCLIFLLYIFNSKDNLLIAQNYIQYHNLVNEAEYWLYKQEYKKAEKLYKRAFRLEKAFSKDSYLLAKCYALQGKKKACHNWLKKSSATPISFTPYLIHNPNEIQNFKRIFSKKGEFDKLSLELKSIKKEVDKQFKNDTYKMLQDTIAALCLQDQLYRKNATQEELNNDLYLKLLHQNDLDIQQKLLDIIKKYSYPGYPKIGTDNGNLILVHILNDDKTHRIYKELLYEELKKGNILPFGYAYMMDRWHLVNKNICYLSMRIYTQKLCTEDDYEGIVERRLNIGLSIYFTGQRRKFSTYNLHPWVNDEFVKKHSFLNKKCN